MPPLWLIVDSVLVLLLGAGAIYYFVKRRSYPEPTLAKQSELPPDYDYLRDPDPRRPPHFHTTESRNRPRSADTPGATTTGGKS